MINTTLLFFLLLLPISGFIAWAGDRIGHRLGKRRASLFGLRPRHTAIFITITFGIGITLASFGTMLLISRSFRQVVARGGALARDNVELQRTLSAAKQRLEDVRKEQAIQDKKLVAAQKAAETALARQQTAERAVVTAQLQFSIADEKLKAETASLASTRSNLRLAVARVEKAKRDVRDALMKRTLAMKASAEAGRKAQAARKEAGEAKGRVATAERVFEAVMQQQRVRLAEQREQLKELEDAVSKQLSSLQSQKQTIESQQDTIDMQSSRLDRQKEQVEEQGAELARLTRDVAELSARRTEVQQALDALSIEAVTMRSGKITYRNGEEVARMQVPATRSVGRIQNTLETLLAVAAKNAELRGAKATKSSARAVRIPDRNIRLPTGQMQTISEFEALAAAAFNIAAEGEPVVIVLFATSNAVSGEAVSVDVRTFRNPLLFSAGTVLGELPVTNSISREKVADKLYQLLRGDIRRKLLKAGIIPPSLGTGVDGEPIGETRIDDVLKVLDLARSVSRSKIVIRTEKDIRAGDAVILSFTAVGIDGNPLGARPDDAVPSVAPEP
jgi:uncharacterized protein (DUF3084 family)